MVEQQERDSRALSLSVQMEPGGASPSQTPEQSPPQPYSEWLRCRPWIEAALRYSGGTHDISDIEDGLMRGVYQFWPGKRSAMVTEICEFPRRRTLNVFLGGGDIRELAEMRPDVERYAKFRGCDAVTLIGRRGWLRSFLKNVGYAEKWVMMAKDI
jgi:hypothetical protein